MLEAVINISEGQDRGVLNELARSCGSALLDVHSDAHHNRSVFTLAGPEVEPAARALAGAAIDLLDINRHSGVHPRIGVVDVVPFVPLEGSTQCDAIRARNAFAAWAATLEVPSFLYGPERSLPDIRKHAFDYMSPDYGPSNPHPTAGAIAVGQRDVLIAYNLWLDADLETGKGLARQLRGPSLRTLGLQVGDRVQLSCNLVRPDEVTPADVFDMVREVSPVAGAELVGLLPRAILKLIPSGRWTELDLSLERTIEARLHDRDGLDRRSSS